MRALLLWSATFAALLLMLLGTMAEASTCPSLYRTLSFGSRGADVVALQNFLIDQELLAMGNNSGYFGRLTQTAVQKFQCQYMSLCSGSPSTNGYGQVGPSTRVAIASVCSGVSTTTSAYSRDASCTAPWGASVAPSASVIASQAPSVPYGQQCVSEIRTCNNGTLSGSYQYQYCNAGTAASCTTPWGSTLPNGSSTVAFQAASVTNGQQCVQESRTCTNGTLSGSNQYRSCTVGTASPCTFNGQTVQSGQSVIAYQKTTVPYGQQCSSVAQTRTCTNGTLSGSYTYSSCAPEQYPTMPNPAQTIEVEGHNVYSPFPVLFNGQPRLYFGGWQNQGQTHDNIYVADCPFAAGACSSVRTVIDAQANGYDHVNDPTIVVHPAIGTTPAYYIMYMTVSAGATDNGVYYSTSWADDGINWSKPALLIANFWLPSAVMKDGHVYLWANSLTDGRVGRFDLGDSGIAVGVPQYSAFNNPSAIPPFYSNVDVQWRPSINAYQMVAERALSTVPGDASVIDFLTSSDGLNWHLVYPAIIRAESGQFRVGTPSQWVDSANWIYFGSTAQSDSMGFKVRFAQWSNPTAMAPTNAQLASALAALSAALDAIEKLLAQ